MDGDMVLTKFKAPGLATNEPKGKLTAKMSAECDKTRQKTHTANPGTKAPRTTFSRPGTRWALARRDAHHPARPNAPQASSHPAPTNPSPHRARPDPHPTPPTNLNPCTDANAPPGPARPIGAADLAQSGPGRNPPDGAPGNGRFFGSRTSATPRAEGSTDDGRRRATQLTPARNGAGVQQLIL